MLQHFVFLQRNKKKGGKGLGFFVPASVVMNMPIRGGRFGACMGRLAGQPLWMWVVMLSALLVDNASACPALCTCSGTTVDCHGLGLRSMPRNIPRNTERL